MNGRQKNKLAAYVVTAAIETDADPGILAQLPDSAQHFTSLKEAITKIEQAHAAQLHYAKPASGDKKEARAALVDSLFNNAAAFCALSVKMKNRDLADEWNLSVNAVRKLTDLNLLATAGNLRAAMTPFMTDLEPYGIKEGQLTALSDAAAAFSALMPLPRTNQLSEREASLQLRDGFAQADAALSALDILVRMLRKREPAFYADYRNRRTPLKSPARPHAISGTVTNGKGNPLQFVRISIDGLPNVAGTTAKGNFRFSNVEDGVHVLRFRCHGFEEHAQAVSVNHNRSERATIALREL